ncbi:carboxypeptidase-like regulatory domain-containing protein [Paenibacillus piri]|nr:carboxypeptidase-like regulatory domain-containing protein [Paenibacillus piri]
MNRLSQSLALLILTASCFTGCTGQLSKSAAPAPTQPPERHNVRLELDQPAISLKQWRMDGSHMTSVNGKLLLDDQPVSNGILQASNTKKDIITGEDGSFRLTVDQSLLTNTTLQVKSLDKATVSGNSLSANMAKDVLAAATSVSVHYPIRVKKVEDDPGDSSKVKVHGQIVAGVNDVVSFFQVDKYRIGGVVKDSEGKPVQNAVVWFDRDEGEGFGKSTPTDENGNYSIFYLPEDEETNITVVLGTTKYTLPEGKVFRMPENTSVEINIMLPGEGTVIDDKPPTLVAVTSPGAMYTGVLAGLNVPEGTPYTVTIPDKEGNFVVTVAKQIWEKKPAFFETKVSKFVQQGKLTWGDTLPPDFVQPGVEDPKVVTPI